MARNRKKSKNRAKKLEQKKIDELEELQKKLNFAAIKNRFW